MVREGQQVPIQIRTDQIKVFFLEVGPLISIPGDIILENFNDPFFTAFFCDHQEVAYEHFCAYGAGVLVIQFFEVPGENIQRYLPARKYSPKISRKALVPK